MSTSFDRVASVYDATRGLPPDVSAQITQGLIEIAEATDETRFFEAGVGTGRIALPIALRGFKYVGVDLSGRMLDELVSKLEQDTPFNGLRADITKLPFADDCFDVALTSHVLHLVEEWRVALDEIRRTLRRGGLYLHCEGSGSRWKTPIHEAWLEIADRHDVPLRGRYNSRTAEVLGYLREHDAKISIRCLAQWESEISVDETVRLIAARTYSSYWTIPDDVFDPMVAELHDWVSTNTEPNDVLRHDNSFTVTSARFQAGVS